MPAITWKPRPPAQDRDQALVYDSLGDWMRVPWSHVFLLTYNGSTSSAAISDMPSPTATMQYRKQRDSSRMIFMLQCTQYAAAANAQTSLYLSNTGVGNGYVSTDPFIGSIYHNAAAAQHIGFGGAVYLDSMPAGLYTLKLRWRSVSGAHTISVDANDYHFITVTETNINPGL